MSFDSKDTNLELEICLTLENTEEILKNIPEKMYFLFEFSFITP